MDRIEEVCRKLKPVLGKDADLLWQRYLLSTPKTKRFLERTIYQLQAKHLGSSLDQGISLAPPTKEQAKAKYPLGAVLYQDKELYEFGLTDEDFLRHIAIYGSTGAGKTNVSFFLLGSLFYNEIPFLVFDWKRNYRDLLSKENLKDKIHVFTVGRDISPFHFNPLIPPSGTPPKAWLKKLIEIIASALYCGEGVKYILLRAIDAVYEKAGLYDGFVEKYPTMQDVFEYLHQYKAKGREGMWMVSALRSIQSLCFGGIGDVINSSSQTSIEDILEKNCILELDGLSETDKVFLTDTLLLWIHHYRMAEGSREQLKSIILIEEAHHILKQDSKAGGEKVIETVLREIRELGTGIVFIDQMPSLISPVALANANVNICLSLSSRADINAASSCLLLEEKEFLSELKTGQAIIREKGRFNKPFHISFKLANIKKGSVTDGDVAEHMQKWAESADSTPINADESKRAFILQSPSEDIIDVDEELLKDIVKYPLCGVISRYKRMEISRRKGTESKEKLIRMSLIDAEEVSQGNTRVVLLELTKKGYQKLNQIARGFDSVKSKKKESLEHRFWKKKTAERFRDEGYKVIEEEDYDKPGPDLVLLKDGKTIAVEIETGKSDLKKNMRRNLQRQYDDVIVIGTNDAAWKKIDRLGYR